MGITINGTPVNPGLIEGYTVVEDAVSLDPGSFDGGTGTLNYSMPEYANTDDLLDMDVTLTDSERGSVTATVVSITTENGFASVSAVNELNKLNTWQTVLPFQGSLVAYLDYVTALCGLTIGVMSGGDWDEGADPIVTCPGFYGNVWDYVKQLLSAYGGEIVMRDHVIVRPVRTYEADIVNPISRSRTISNESVAHSVDIAYYNYVYGTQVEVYPPQGDNYDSTASAWVVGSGQRVIQELKLDGSLRAVNTPIVQDFVYNQSYSGTNGVYSVTGADNLPVTAAQWTDKGGRLRVETTPDPTVIRIIIDGARIPALAPFRIAMVEPVSGTYYNSLHITGEGVSADVQVLTWPTGVPVAETGEEAAVSVDNPFINTLAQAYTAGLNTVAANTGPALGLSGSAIDLANMDVPGSYFGFVPGARVMSNTANFRINSVTTTEHVSSYEATIDTIIEDFNNRWAGATIAQFNTEWSVFENLKDFRTKPIRRTV